MSGRIPRINISEHYFNLKGKTAEQLVQELALKTFLTDWCYLNPILPNGKELCDLLVVFDDIAIIWQIKDLKLNKQGKYKKSEVAKNLRQLSGAHRQLFQLKTPIELNNPRRGEEPFTPESIKGIYLISVLLGKGEDTLSPLEDLKDSFVHVFDRDFTQIILNELDTISDFTDYLKAKEALLKQKNKFVILGGEEELLAAYLIENRSFENLEKASNVLITQGLWEDFINSQEYVRKKKEDEISYAWDSIINIIHTTSPKYEEVARELARPNRFDRRILSKTYYEARMTADSDNTRPIFRRMATLNKFTYCFLFADDKIVTRKHRKDMLRWICYIARGTFKDNKIVIGIATEKKAQPTYSYDFALLDIPEWTAENQREMEEFQQKTKVFLNPNTRVITESEYPKSRKE